MKPGDAFSHYQLFEDGGSKTGEGFQEFNNKTDRTPPFGGMKWEQHIAHKERMM